MRRRRFKARPVFSDGIQFRSRLEARWATMLRLLKWDYTYEPPLDLHDYIADFAVLDGIAECKPWLKPSDLPFAEGALKAKNSGYLGAVYMLGARTTVEAGRTIVGYTNTHGFDVWIPFHLRRSEGVWYPCTGETCCGKTQTDQINQRWVEYTWRLAGNETQWRRPRSS